MSAPSTPSRKRSTLSVRTSSTVSLSLPSTSPIRTSSVPPSSGHSTLPVRTPSDSPLRLFATSPFGTASSSPGGSTPPVRTSSDPNLRLSVTLPFGNSSSSPGSSTSPVLTSSDTNLRLSATLLCNTSSPPPRSSTALIRTPSIESLEVRPIEHSTSPVRISPSPSSDPPSPTHSTPEVPQPPLIPPPPSDLLSLPLARSGSDVGSSISQDSTLTGNSTQFFDPSHTNPFREKISAAELGWKRQKAVKGAKNKAIDELMGMVGLEEVKEQVLAIKAKVDTCHRQGTNLSGERFNVVFQGNPGTGKTTVARIYAEFLRSCGVLDSGTPKGISGTGMPEESPSTKAPGGAPGAEAPRATSDAAVLKETSGGKMAYKGPARAKNTIRRILLKGGGVLFVDEAYQLTAPHTPGEGRQILDILLTNMENHIGKLVVIFVGYNKEMQSFFEHNPGLASRVPYTLQFTDFEDAELWSILRDSIIKKYNGKMKIEGGMNGLYMRVAIRRLARGRGIRDFGNARAVHNLLAKISERQAKRLTKRREDEPEPDLFQFTREDLIGPDPSEAIFQSAAWAKLQGLIGLKEVKTSANSMIDMIITNHQREIAEKSPLDFSLNRVFFGSPGTGKTTVAKLYGQIMADLGLLSNGEVVLKNPSDFIGECLGKSEAKTRAILATTLGKVLIIDEAYMLNTGGTGNQHDTYKTAVIDTLVAEVQSVPGDDRCILILGYEDKLKEMFHNVNPGLSRRFAIDDPFRFQDFDLLELEQILKLKMREQDVSTTPKALSVALEVLDRARMRPNFCNGGEVDNCLAKAKINYQTRQSKKPVLERSFDAIFEPADFDPDWDRNSNAVANCRTALEGIVGNDIIEQMEVYQKLAIATKASGLDPRKEVPTNFVFKGPPGTGKTTTARNMGKIYYDMGFLSTDEVIECSASDLIGQFVGHTGPKTKTQLERALGKVLFVDEAYRLTEGQYATEASNELIYLLTTPKYAGKLIVILAGYTQDMNKLMSARPALSGLFPEEIVFQNIKPHDCLNLLDRELEQKRISAPFLKDRDSPEYNKLLRLVRMLSVFPTWSNARDIKTLAKEMSGIVFRERNFTPDLQPTPDPKCSPDLWPILSEEQAVRCMKKIISMQYGRSSSVERKGTKPPPTAVESCQAASQPLGLVPGPTVAHDEAPCCDTLAKARGVADKTKGPAQSTSSAPGLGPLHRISTKLGKLQRTGSSHRHLHRTSSNHRQPHHISSSHGQSHRISTSSGGGTTDPIQEKLEADKVTAEAALKRHQQTANDPQASKSAPIQRVKGKEKAIPLDDEYRNALMQRAEIAKREAERCQQEYEAEEMRLEKLRQEDIQNEEKEQQEQEAEAKRREKLEQKEKEEFEKRRQALEAEVERVGKLKQEYTEKKLQEKAAKTGVCPNGFSWKREGNGFRCEGGEHFVSDEQLEG